MLFQERVMYLNIISILFAIVVRGYLELIPLIVLFTATLFFKMLVFCKAKIFRRRWFYKKYTSPLFNDAKFIRNTVIILIFLSLLYFFLAVIVSRWSIQIAHIVGGIVLFNAFLDVVIYDVFSISRYLRHHTIFQVYLVEDRVGTGLKHFPIRVGELSLMTDDDACFRMPTRTVYRSNILDFEVTWREKTIKTNLVVNELKRSKFYIILDADNHLLKPLDFKKDSVVLIPHQVTKHARDFEIPVINEHWDKWSNLKVSIENASNVSFNRGILRFKGFPGLTKISVSSGRSFITKHIILAPWKGTLVVDKAISKVSMIYHAGMKSALGPIGSLIYEKISKTNVSILCPPCRASAYSLLCSLPNHSNITVEIVVDEDEKNVMLRTCRKIDAYDLLFLRKLGRKYNDILMMLEESSSTIGFDFHPIIPGDRLFLTGWGLTKKIHFEEGDIIEELSKAFEISNSQMIKFKMLVQVPFFSESVRSALGANYEPQEVFITRSQNEAWGVKDSKLGKKLFIKVRTAYTKKDRLQFDEIEKIAVALSKVESKRFPKFISCKLVENQVFVVTEWIDGESLSERLSKGMVLDAQWAIERIIEIAEALDVMHSVGVIHRDVKPENIMLSKDESAFLVDFDIAVRTNSPSALYGAGTSTTIAPEQICHPSIANESTDIYSLGCCLYLLLTGHWPFIDEPSRLSKPASNLTQINPKIPDPLIRIVDTCLQKEWWNRYENTKKLIDDLHSISIDELREMGTLPSAVPHAYRGIVYLQGPYLK